MPDETLKKKEGFQGQKAVVIPRTILTRKCARDPMTGTLYLTDIGYYPKARFHYRERSNGADQHILIYCREGGGRARIGKTEFDIQAGDFFIVPARASHLYAADEKTPWSIYWMHFKGSVADFIVSQIVKRSGGYKGFIRYDESSISLFDDMYNELERGYGSDHLKYANMCLWHFMTSFLYNDKYDPSGKFLHKDIADRAIDFLSQRIDQVLNLEDIAAAVNLSPSHFSFLFKKKTGFSPIEYFNHLKIQKACQYLLFTSLRVREIALELGIDDPYYFSRMFTKVMGVSPNGYREKRIQ